MFGFNVVKSDANIHLPIFQLFQNQLARGLSIIDLDLDEEDGPRLLISKK